MTARHLPRAPLPAQGVTSYGVVSMHDIRERYLSFIAPTGSCARPNSSCHLHFILEQQVFAGCCESLLEDGLSRHYLCNPCVGAWTPAPQRPFSAFARFFLKDNGLTSDVTGSAHQTTPAMQLQQGYFFSGLQSFLYVPAPMLASPQIAPTAVSIYPRGSRAVYATQ